MFLHIKLYEDLSQLFLSEKQITNLAIFLLNAMQGLIVICSYDVTMPMTASYVNFPIDACFQSDDLISEHFFVGGYIGNSQIFRGNN